MDLYRWTCRCGVSNIAVEESKAQQDGADHAFDRHGLLVIDAVTFDVYTEAAQKKDERTHRDAEAERLGMTADELAELRVAALPPERAKP